MIEEIIIPIKGYEGLYKISNYGHVITCRKKKGRNGIIVPEKVKIHSYNNSGYRIVSLSNDGVRKCFKIHRLVAMHFIPNPNNHPEVGHGVLGKECNAVWNLQWVTRLENERQAWERGEKVGGASHFSSKEILQFTKDGLLIAKYGNGTIAQESTGFNRSVIQRAARGDIKTAYGYTWKY